jgi:hypothetical protein
LEVPLDREDIILLLLEANERLLGSQSLNGATRLEKLIYLLREESSFERVAALFKPFVAHNFGPFSKEVYEAAEFLEGCDLIEITEKAYSYYAAVAESRLEEESDPAISEVEATDNSPQVSGVERRFSLTENGRKVARIWIEGLKARRPSDLVEVESIIRRFGSLPLNQLIRYVYRRHPDMVANSIHPEAKRLSR